MTNVRSPMFLFSRGRGWGVVAGLVGAVLLAVLAWAVIDHPVHYDELLHILSARGLLQTGQPAIAEGFYTRAELFTRAVAWSFRHFGDNPVSARLPALAAAAALAFILGVWVVRQSGLLAGAAAVLLLCVVPGTIGVAVFARFYTVHAVLMLLLFIAAYAAMLPGRAAWARALAVVVFAGLIPLGAHFQETTVIAVGAAVAAALALLLLDHWAGIKPLIRRQPILLLGVLGLVVAGILVAVESRGLLAQLGMTPLWAARNAARYQYYLVEFRNELPLLWPLLPVAVVVGVLRPANRRLAVFCAVAVGSALLVHSVAAQKSLRYVYYLVPLMCVLWAIGLANVVALVVERGTSPGSGGARRSTLAATALLAAVFLLSQEGSRALNLLAGRDTSPSNRPYADEPDWTSLVAELGPRARSADHVVTSNSMKALYYLGRYDYELNATIVPETETHAEFGRDRRTGRQAIGTAESIRQVLTLPGTTLLVIEASKLGRSSGVSSEAFEVIEAHCDELSLPAGTGVRAWWCDAPPRVTPGSALQ